VSVDDYVTRDASFAPTTAEDLLLRDGRVRKNGGCGSGLTADNSS